MADVAECIAKLVATGKISRAIPPGRAKPETQGSDFWWPQGSTAPQRAPNH